MSYARYVDYFFAVRRLDSCVFGAVGSSFYPHKGHYVGLLSGRYGFRLPYKADCVKLY